MASSRSEAADLRALVDPLINTVVLASIRDWRDPTSVWISAARVSHLLGDDEAEEGRVDSLRSFLRSDSNLHPLIEHDIMANVSNLSSRDKVDVSMFAAATQIGGISLVGAILRGPDPERPNIWRARLIASPFLDDDHRHVCVHVGTSSHLEGFRLNGSDHRILDSACLGGKARLALAMAFRRALLPVKVCNGEPAGTVLIPLDVGIAMAALLTGMIHASSGGERANPPLPPIPAYSGGSIPLPPGSPVWLFPTRLDEPLSSIPPEEFAILRAYFNHYIKLVGHYSVPGLKAIAGHFRPQVKDLIRLVAEENGSSNTPTAECYRIAVEAPRFVEATRAWRGS